MEEFIIENADEITVTIVKVWNGEGKMKKSNDKKYQWVSYRSANNVLNNILSITDSKAQEKPLYFKYKQFSDGQIAFMIEYRSSIWKRYTSYEAPGYGGHIIPSKDGCVVVMKRHSFWSRLSNFSSVVVTVVAFVQAINGAISIYNDPARAAREHITLSAFGVLMGSLALFFIGRYIYTFKKYSDPAYLLNVIKNAAGIY